MKPLLFSRYAGRSRKAKLQVSVWFLDQVLSVMHTKGMLDPLPESLDNAADATGAMRASMFREACQYAYYCQQLALASERVDVIGVEEEFEAELVQPKKRGKKSGG